MSTILGIDTSNYTTSAALLCRGGNKLNTASRLLPVAQGELGLRQSEAVFHHTRALPEIIAQAVDGGETPPAAIAVSVRPRDAEGSYMPCFLAGASTAHSLANVLRVPVYEFSHQAGHIAAAAYGADRLSVLTEKFIAFHLSGGTTEGVLVTPDKEKIFTVTPLCRTLDLNAGQVVDRVGRLLGLDFPAGKALDALAARGELPKGAGRIRPCLKGHDCCLSGVVNRCEKLLSDGQPGENVARYCLEYILETLAAMTDVLLAEQGALPLLYAGGVMSNSLIRERMTERYGAYFAPPRFSTDNAAGIAVLGGLRHGTF